MLRKLLLWVCLMPCFMQAQALKIWSNSGVASHKELVTTLSVYHPTKELTNHSAVVVCPGGSYYYHAIKRESDAVAQWLQNLGFTACVLRYRVGISGARHPDMIEDLQRSIQLVRDSATCWNIAPNQVGVMGFSAGGHLVGTSAILGGDYLSPLGMVPQVSLQPDFCVMVYPVVTMQEPFVHQKSRYNLLRKGAKNVDIQRAFSLEQQVKSDMPPILLVQAKDDKTVMYQNSVMLNQALDKVNASHKFILYKTGGHGFGVEFDPNTDMYQWMSDFEQWYKSLTFK